MEAKPPKAVDLTYGSALGLGPSFGRFHLDAYLDASEVMFILDAYLDASEVISIWTFILDASVWTFIFGRVIWTS